MSESKLFTLVKKHSDDLAASVSSAETKFDEDPDLWLKVSIRSDLGPWIRRLKGAANWTERFLGMGSPPPPPPPSRILRET